MSIESIDYFMYSEMYFSKLFKTQSDMVNKYMNFIEFIWIIQTQVETVAQRKLPVTFKISHKIMLHMMIIAERAKQYAGNKMLIKREIVFFLIELSMRIQTEMMRIEIKWFSYICDCNDENTSTNASVNIINTTERWNEIQMRLRTTCML